MRPTRRCRAGAWPAATAARARSSCRGRGEDGSGSGVSNYTVEVSTASDGAGASQAEPEWRTLLDQAPTNGLHFRGDSGDAYRFRITARDRALNSATIVTDPVLVPVDDRDRGLLRLSTRLEAGACRAGLGPHRRPGRSAPERRRRLRFGGTQVALIGRKLRGGGRLRVTIDGRSRVLRRARPHPAPERAVGEPDGSATGSHVLRLRSLGGGPVELDAVAPSP